MMDTVRWTADRTEKWKDRGQWIERVTDREGNEQMGQLIASAMDRRGNGQRGKWTESAMDRRGNGQRGKWTESAMDREISQLVGAQSAVNHKGLHQG